MSQKKEKQCTTPTNTEEEKGAKRSKTEAMVSNVKNKLVSALKAMIDSMKEKDLYSVMAYVATVGKEETTSSDSDKIEFTEGVVASAASATTTTTTEVTGATASATTTTTTTGGTTTATPATAPIVNEATPPPIQFNYNLRPRPADTIVKIVPRCFNFGRTDCAADDMRRKKVLSLVNAIAKDDMSLEQQALVLQQAVVHPLVRPIAKSAGLVDNNNFMIQNYVMKNIKRASSLAQKTLHKYKQTNDDLRSFVQSLVLSTLPSTQQQLEDKQNGVFVPSYNQIADAIGVSKNKYHRIRTEKQVKRDLLELRGETDGVIPTGTIFSQIVKSKGWTKVDKDLEQKVHSFIENHRNVTIRAAQIWKRVFLVASLLYVGAT